MHPCYLFLLYFFSFYTRDGAIQIQVEGGGTEQKVK